MNTIDSISVDGWQDLFNSIIEDADSNVLLLDEDLRVISLNPGFYWFFIESYGVELKRGASFPETLKNVNPQLSQEWEKRCLMASTGSAIKIEEAFGIDGHNFHWEIHVKATKGPLGNPVISIFSRDITVRKAFQKKIIESEANVRSILNTIDDSVWLVNTKFQLIDFNKEFYKQYKIVFGVRLLKGENIIDIIPAHLSDVKEKWRQRYTSGLKGRPGKFIDEFSDEKGQHVYEVKTFPIVEDGIVRGLTVYSRDITAQMRTENLLKNQNDELSVINSELDKFVYSASHDLRAPLMSVKGLLNMIKLSQDEESKHYYLTLIEQSVNKLDNFITDIINYSRNSRMDLIINEINFEEILKESIDSLKFMEGAEKVRSEKRVQANHPFYSDFGRLQIIFNNIISNAVKYRAQWRADSFVRIEITTEPDKAIISFIDNGVGIAPQYLNNIFKMFFRASADSKGSGLGLYIVKGAVEKIKGAISVQSEYGQGTTFRIEVPNLKR